jgi:hypothetical protein
MLKRKHRLTAAALGLWLGHICCKRQSPSLTTISLFCVTVGVAGIVVDRPRGARIVPAGQLPRP